MHKVITISTDNNVEIKDVKEIDYDLLYTEVNGLVELVSLHKDIDMWVNEEGKYNGSAVNILATVLWNEVFDKPDIIMGNVIITGGADEEGNSMGLDDSSITEIMMLIHNGLNNAINDQEQE